MDERSIDNPDAGPTDPSDMPDELEEAVRSDAGEAPVEGEDVGSSGETVQRPGDGLVTEEGVNEPGTRADSDP